MQLTLGILMKRAYPVCPKLESLEGWERFFFVPPGRHGRVLYDSQDVIGTRVHTSAMIVVVLSNVGTFMTHIPIQQDDETCHILPTIPATELLFARYERVAAGFPGERCTKAFSFCYMTPEFYNKEFQSRWNTPTPYVTGKDIKGSLHCIELQPEGGHVIAGFYKLSLRLYVDGRQVD